MNFWYPPVGSVHEYTVRTSTGGAVSNQNVNRFVAICVLSLAGCVAITSSPAWGQEEINRTIKSKVAPVYPDLARRMNIAGVVKVQITVAANGSVKNAKLVGGHPVLANAALDAVKRWRFEAGPQESTGVVQFRFDPGQ
jgi:TonB family protein